MRRFAVMLMLAGVVGCGGSNPAPTSAPPADPAGPTTSTPTGPVVGKLNGQPFAPDSVELEGRKLTFRQGKDPFKATEVALTLAGEGSLADGTKVTVKAADKWPDSPLASLVVTTLKNDFPDTKFVDGGVTLTLDLGKPAGGKVAGTIQLTLPDGGELAGTFTAERVRGHDEPPTAADAPFVRGTITYPAVKGKAKPPGPDFEPGPTLSVGYVELTGKDWLGDRVGGPLPADGEGPNWWMQSATFKPRVATLTFEKEGARYEFTKLPPGMYLIFAGLKGGPQAWVKVEVKAGDQLTHDFKLEAGKGGTVEVATPADLTGEVRLVPSDLIPSDDANHVGGRIATQLDLGGKAEQGKATVADVPPGKYTLFVVPGTLSPRGTVEVKAGETAKVEIKDVK